MADFTIKKDSLNFLTELSKNNNRDWFSSHRLGYETARDNIIAFADALLIEMNKHDHIETTSGKKSVFRIYKDVRFSKDKTPYNTHWSGRFKRATNRLRGGYYYRIERGNSYLICGFWNPQPDDMKRIRQHIDMDEGGWRTLLADQVLAKTVRRQTKVNQSLCSVSGLK